MSWNWFALLFQGPSVLARPSITSKANNTKVFKFSQALYVIMHQLFKFLPNSNSHSKTIAKYITYSNGLKTLEADAPCHWDHLWWPFSSLCLCLTDRFSKLLTNIVVSLPKLRYHQRKTQSCWMLKNYICICVNIFLSWSND